MSRRNLTTLAAASVVLAATPLLACSAEPEAAPSVTSQVAPPVTPTPATPPPTSSPTESTPQVIPPLEFAGELNENDATLFGAYYLQVLNYTRQTNDSSRLRAISDPSCEECLNIAGITDEFAQRGMFYANPTVKYEQAFLDYFDAQSGEADVRLQVSGDLGLVNNRDGSTQGKNFPFQHAEVMVLLRFTSAGWRLIGLP